MLTGSLTVAAVALTVLAQLVAAFPSSLSCTANNGNWARGASCGLCISGTMGQLSNTFGSQLNCAVNVDSTASGTMQFNPCQTYLITVTSSSAGHKINSNIGTLSGSASLASSPSCRSMRDNVVTTSSQYAWTAPAGTSSNVVISSVCGNQGAGINAALQLTMARNTSAETFASGCPVACFGAGCGGGNSATTMTVSAFVVIMGMLATALLT